MVYSDLDLIQMQVEAIYYYMTQMAELLHPMRA